MSKYILQNKRQIQFYDSHPEIDFEAVNGVFIDLLEKLSLNLSKTLTDNLSTDMLKSILSKMTDLEKNNSENSNLLKLLDERTRTNLSTIKLNLDDSISKQKDNIISDIREIIKNNQTDYTEFIHKIISDNHSLLLERFSNNLNSLPSELQKHILSKDELLKHIGTINSLISSEIEKSNSSSINIDSISSIINAKYNELNQNFSTRIDSVISSTASSTNTNLVSILERLKPMESVEEYFNSGKNSNIKGKRGENKLEPILSEILPDAEITNSSGTAESGDFIIERIDKPKILIDTKDYATSIPKKEVVKIIRDIEKRNCNGILLSQNSGISLKHDFEINIHNNHILLFLHNVQYSEDKIYLAIQIIDSLFPIIQKQKSLEFESISSEQLNMINKEFQALILQKKQLVDQFEKYNREMVKEIGKIDMPTISSILTSKFSMSEKLQYVCDICNEYSGKNARALSAHKRGCSKKKPILVL
jgi:hypothetical protein